MFHLKTTHKHNNQQKNMKKLRKCKIPAVHFQTVCKQILE